jgi:hypothetical protein
MCSVLFRRIALTMIKAVMEGVLLPAETLQAAPAEGGGVFPVFIFSTLLEQTPIKFADIAKFSDAYPFCVYEQILL